MVKSVTNTWHVHAIETGSRVSLTSRLYAGPRPLQQLIAKALGRRLGQASDQMTAGLKARLS